MILEQICTIKNCYYTVPKMALCSCRGNLALCARLPSGQRFVIGRAPYLVFSGAPCLHSNKIHKTIYTSDLYGSERVTLLPFTLFPFGLCRTSFYFSIFILVPRSLRPLPSPTLATTVQYQTILAAIATSCALCTVH